jgi:hypothetical protein
MNDSTAAVTYVGQLAEHVAELLPDIGTPERLDLLGVMESDDLRTSLAFIASMYPQVFDFALVRDRKMAERLVSRLEEDRLDPYCTVCGAILAHFHGHSDKWVHYTGEGTIESPVKILDAGHEPVIEWREAGAR